MSREFVRRSEAFALFADFHVGTPYLELWTVCERCRKEISHRLYDVREMTDEERISMTAMADGLTDAFQAVEHVCVDA